MIGSDEVRRCARVCADALSRWVEADWTVPVPGLDFTAASVVAHAAEGCLWYAIDLAAAGRDLPPVEHRVESDSAPADLIDTLVTYADVVAAVIELAPPSARGFHPAGMADPSGFAAMACDEMLIHTDDAVRGLGWTFEPPEDLVATVLARLFPWVTPEADPWNELLWANGRIALGPRPRLSGWAWHCAPLDEWDGTIPTR